MFVIQDIVVSEALLQQQFVCHLDKCKGACCWEGDYGAPLEPEEIDTLHELLPEIKTFLSAESIALIDAEGPTDYFAEPGFRGTRLHDNGSCAFLTFDANGIAKCGIEQAYEAGQIDWKKPVSCHLYPVRVKRIEHMSFEALNYDQWDICSAACTLGHALKVPLYVFVKDALIRKYGEEFWNELDQVARDLDADGRNTI